MTDRMHVQTVGAPDPELKNSAIADEGDDEFEVIKLESPGYPPVTQFNVLCTRKVRVQRRHTVALRSRCVETRRHCDPTIPDSHA